MKMNSDKMVESIIKISNIIKSIFIDARRRFPRKLFGIESKINDLAKMHVNEMKIIMEGKDIKLMTVGAMHITSSINELARESRVIIHQIIDGRETARLMKDIYDRSIAALILARKPFKHGDPTNYNKLIDTILDKFMDLNTINVRKENSNTQIRVNTVKRVATSLVYDVFCSIQISKITKNEKNIIPMMEFASRRLDWNLNYCKSEIIGAQA